MTPLDDQLRQTLASRAAGVSPTADPLVGIESRASRIRRRRTLTAMTAAAAAVAAVALAVPALTPGRSTPNPQPFATTSPNNSATPSLTPSPAAPSPQAGVLLDPAAPWAFRGEDSSLGNGILARFRATWAIRHPGLTLTPLYARVYEPSGQTEVAFIATDGTNARVGYGLGDKDEVFFAYDESYGPIRQAALQFASFGDEGGEGLIVIAAPDTRRMESAANGVTFVSLTALAPGVGVTNLDEATAQARLRVIGADGSETYNAPARRAQTLPNNLLDWAVRGQESVSPSVEDLSLRYAQAFGRRTTEGVHYRPLFVGDTDSGVRFTVGQAWFAGSGEAHTVSYSTGGTNGPEFFLGEVTVGSPPVLAYLVGNLPGTSVDFLVVVPTPTSGQVSYSAGASGAFRPITGQDHLGGVVIIDRSKTATDDRLEILDGNGNPDAPLYRGPVTPLLCGLRECG